MYKCPVCANKIENDVYFSAFCGFEEHPANDVIACPWCKTDLKLNFTWRLVLVDVEMVVEKNQ